MEFSRIRTLFFFSGALVGIVCPAFGGEVLDVPAGCVFALKHPNAMRAFERVVDEGQRQRYARLEFDDDALVVHSPQGTYRLVAGAKNSAEIPRVDFGLDGRLSGEVRFSPTLSAEALEKRIRLLVRGDVIHAMQKTGGPTILTYPQRDDVDALNRMNFPWKALIKPVGTGKTVTSAHYIKQRPGNVAFIVQNQDILDGAIGSYKREIGFEEEEVGRWWGNTTKVPVHSRTRLIGSTRGTAVARIDDLRERLRNGDRWYVIFDEGHHLGLTDGEFADLVKMIREVQQAGYPVEVGILSATLWHPDMDMIETMTHGNVWASGLSTSAQAQVRRGENLPELAKQQMLDSTFSGYNAPAESIIVRRKVGGVAATSLLYQTEYNDDEERELTVHQGLIQDVWEQTLALRKNHYDRGLLFAPTQTHANEYAKRLNLLAKDQGEFRPYHSGINKAERAANKAWLEDPQAKQHRYLIVIDAFNEGVDIPIINYLVFLRNYGWNTQGFQRFYQNWGRAARIALWKTGFRVLDYSGMTLLLADHLPIARGKASSGDKGEGGGNENDEAGNGEGNDENGGTILVVDGVTVTVKQFESMRVEMMKSHRRTEKSEILSDDQLSDWIDAISVLPRAAKLAFGVDNFRENGGAEDALIAIARALRTELGVGEQTVATLIRHIRAAAFSATSGGSMLYGTGTGNLERYYQLMVEIAEVAKRADRFALRVGELKAEAFHPERIYHEETLRVLLRALGYFHLQPDELARFQHDTVPLIDEVKTRFRVPNLRTSWGLAKLFEAVAATLPKELGLSTPDAGRLTGRIQSLKFAEVAGGQMLEGSAFHTQKAYLALAWIAQAAKESPRFATVVGSGPAGRFYADHVYEEEAFKLLFRAIGQPVHISLTREVILGDDRREPFRLVASELLNKHREAFGVTSLAANGAGLVQLRDMIQRLRTRLGVEEDVTRAILEELTYLQFPLMAGRTLLNGTSRSAVDSYYKILTLIARAAKNSARLAERVGALRARLFDPAQIHTPEMLQTLIDALRDGTPSADTGGSSEPGGSGGDDKTTAVVVDRTTIQWLDLIKEDFDVGGFRNARGAQKLLMALARRTRSFLGVDERTLTTLMAEIEGLKLDASAGQQALNGGPLTESHQKILEGLRKIAHVAHKGPKFAQRVSSATARAFAPDKVEDPDQLLRLLDSLGYNYLPFDGSRWENMMEALRFVDIARENFDIETLRENGGAKTMFRKMGTYLVEKFGVAEADAQNAVDRIRELDLPERFSAGVLEGKPSRTIVGYYRAITLLARAAHAAPKAGDRFGNAAARFRPDHTDDPEQMKYLLAAFGVKFLSEAQHERFDAALKDLFAARATWAGRKPFDRIALEAMIRALETKGALPGGTAQPIVAYGARLPLPQNLQFEKEIFLDPVVSRREAFYRVLLRVAGAARRSPRFDAAVGSPAAAIQFSASAVYEPETLRVVMRVLGHEAT